MMNLKTGESGGPEVRIVFIAQNPCSIIHLATNRTPSTHTPIVYKTMQISSAPRGPQVDPNLAFKLVSRNGRDIQRNQDSIFSLPLALALQSAFSSEIKTQPWP